MTRTQTAGRSKWIWPVRLLGFTVVAFLIDGYHPWSEDGGIYATAIEHLLNPSLFPQRTEFVTAYLHLSVFPYVVMALVRLTHAPLSYVLLFLHLASLWLLLWAARLLMQVCRLSEQQQRGGLALLSVWSSLPIAGTSLLLTDPYLSARSFATPLCVIAMALALRDWTVRRDVSLCAATLLVLLVVHPITALHAACLVTAVRAVQGEGAAPRRRSLYLSVTLLLVSAAVYATAPKESSDAMAAGVTRYYWFLSQWHWYELAGLAAPYGILLAVLVWKRVWLTPAARNLLRATLLMGLLVLVISLLFIHSGDAKQMLDRAQPLRLFLVTYLVMALALGVASQSLMVNLGTRTGFALWLIMSSGALFYAQRETYAHSTAYEWPWTDATPNRWQQAFRWVRLNTPVDAFFALDADYITMHDEDAQLFRPLALRSSLADRSKDGGVAANRPTLAPLWASDVSAQAGLSKLPDEIRDTRLTPLGVTWMVLQSPARTAHACPYDNGTVKVCALRGVSPY